MIRQFSAHFAIVLVLAGGHAGALAQAVNQEAVVAAPDEKYFGIRVVDRETGRGVPLVTLTTVNDIPWVTDSAGWIAFHEPGLMDQTVYFGVSSHGYQFPEDGFGFRGVRLETKPGTTAIVEIDRDPNIAERVCRLTGAGIWRDSILLGQDVPVADPGPAGQVVGQDSVQGVVYQGKICWFWGDTSRAFYPLGNFRTSGATSRLAPFRDNDPARGIELEYFVDDEGFSRPMAPADGPGVVWIQGVFVLDVDGGEAMFAHYSRRASLAEQLEHGLLRFNDATDMFDIVARFDEDAALYPRGQAFGWIPDGQPYIYFATPWPTVRVPASLDAVTDPRRYEAWTCLEPGTQLDEERTRIERDERRQPVWGWKANTASIGSGDEARLVELGLLLPEERRLRLYAGPAPVSDDPAADVALHSGSVRWNEWRQRWVMIGLQAQGEFSFLGDVWYAEADRPEGPWVNARRVVVHDQYSFYNPVHHDFLDQRGGRNIYFQGTYSHMFSGTEVPTPRYNYNQILYRLSLDGAALDLPRR